MLAPYSEMMMSNETSANGDGLGETHAVKTSAMLTAMGTPLGRAAGNALEAEESVECLEGKGPEDVVEVTLELTRERLRLVGVDADPAAALAGGSALTKYGEMICAQGGDPKAPLPEASERCTVAGEHTGYVHRLDARSVGMAAWKLGAGRAVKEDPVSPSAGVVCLAKPGDFVEKGQPVLELQADDGRRFDAAMAALDTAISIAAEEPGPRPLILESIAP